MLAAHTLALVSAGLIVATLAACGTDPSLFWQDEWPRTEFSKHSFDLGEIRSGGPPREGIPPIDDPAFLPGAEAERDLDPKEPVVSLILGDDARAYPLRVPVWHEIINDTAGGVPVAVTYCPLCNTGIVFDRGMAGHVLDLGTTGKLRHSDLVMYDRQAESWWQHFGGDAIVGSLAGARLRALPSHLESVKAFRARAPRGRILVPRDPGFRRYGSNPHVG